IRPGQGGLWVIATDDEPLRVKRALDSVAEDQRLNLVKPPPANLLAGEVDFQRPRETRRHLTKDDDGGVLRDVAGNRINQLLQRRQLAAIGLVGRNVEGDKNEIAFSQFRRAAREADAGTV